MITSPNSPPAIDNASLQEVLLQIQNVQLAILFGSVAKETANSDSDLDIAVLADHKLSSDEKIQLIQGLAEKIGRPIDLIDLFDPPQPLLGQIIKSGRKIFGTDEAFAKLAYRNMVDQADFMPLRSRALLERRDAWINK